MMGQLSNGTKCDGKSFIYHPASAYRNEMHSTTSDKSIRGANDFYSMYDMLDNSCRSRFSNFCNSTHMRIVSSSFQYFVYVMLADDTPHFLFPSGPSPNK